MPATGTATYTGNITGLAINTSTFGTIQSGAVSLSVDFASKTVTGSVTNIVTEGLDDTAPTGTMSNINLTGSIAGTSFTLTATGAAAAAGNTVNIAGSSGTFGGTFFGPNAAEIASSSTMTASGITVLAAFGARQ